MPPRKWVIIECLCVPNVPVGHVVLVMSLIKFMGRRMQEAQGLELATPGPGLFSYALCCSLVVWPEGKSFKLCNSYLTQMET